MKRISGGFLLVLTLLLPIFNTISASASESYTFRDDEYSFRRCNGKSSTKPSEKQRGYESVKFENVDYTNQGEILTTCRIVLQYHHPDFVDPNHTLQEGHEYILERLISQAAPITALLINKYSSADKTSYVKIHSLNNYYYGHFYHQIDEETFVGIRVQSLDDSEYIDEAINFLLKSVTRNGKQLYNGSLPNPHSSTSGAFEQNPTL